MPACADRAGQTPTEQPDWRDFLIPYNSHILPTAKAIELLFNFDVVRYFVSERNNRVQTNELTVKTQLPNERCWKLY